MSGTPSGSDYRGLALAGTAVAEIVAPTLVGLWLDNHLGWTPWGAVAGAVAGVSVSIAHLVLVGRKS